MIVGIGAIFRNGILLFDDNLFRGWVVPIIPAARPTLLNQDSLSSLLRAILVAMDILFMLSGFWSV